MSGDLFVMVMMMMVLQLLGILEHVWTLIRDDDDDDDDGAPVTRHFGTCLDTYS